MPLEKFKLDGKTALVTGAAGGIGGCTARALADAGADVCVADVNGDRLNAVADDVATLGRRSCAVVADVLNQDDIDTMVDAAVQEFGRIDIMVNCAGVADIMPSAEVTHEHWDRVTGIDLDGVFFCAQAAGKHMIARGGGGTIVNIASAYGLGASKKHAAYCAAKAGVVNVTRVLAYEWAQHGIRVNCVAPGLIHTDMTAKLREDPQFWEKIVKTAPLRRAGQPEEIAHAVVFLAGDASSFMTGHALVVDGGMSIY